jgi:hypothetical protein
MMLTKNGNGVELGKIGNYDSKNDIPVNVYYVDGTDDYTIAFDAPEIPTRFSTSTTKITVQKDTRIGVRVNICIINLF